MSKAKKPSRKRQPIPVIKLRQVPWRDRTDAEWEDYLERVLVAAQAHGEADDSCPDHEAGDLGQLLRQVWPKIPPGVRAEIAEAWSDFIEQWAHNPTVEEVRAKILALPVDHRCHDNCVGWAVFDSDKYGMKIERCDECWHDHNDPLTDDEAALLPEAQAELERAEEADKARREIVRHEQQEHR